MASKHLTKEQQNYVRFSMVCVDFIKLPLIEILKCQVHPRQLYNKIKLSTALTTGKNKLRPDQLSICFLSPHDTPDYSKFDVTLLYTLIRNLCPTLMPTKGWGNEPEATDRKVGDDIERLRLFRNNYAHFECAKIHNDKFIDLWKILESVIKRIRVFLISNGSSNVMDFKQELRDIERCSFGYEELEKYKLMLEAIMQISKHKYDDEPEISIKDVGEVIYGGTVRLEAEVMHTHHSHWLITWHKVRGDGLEKIDTTSEKYRGSDNKHLVIKSVCKEDEGEYKAILSLHMERKEINIHSNTVAVHALGDRPVITCIHATCNMKDQTVTLNSEIYVYGKSPEIHDVFWTKNREKLEILGSREKYTFKSIQEPSLTIHNVNYIDAGSYQLTAVNAVGATASEVIELGIKIYMLHLLSFVILLAT